MLAEATEHFLAYYVETGKPLAVILAGHNGSGKSTMWNAVLAPRFRMPLINADRMMMSILPEISGPGRLPEWAQKLRDEDNSWMKVAQEGVQSFIARATAAKVAFATETVFSDWRLREDGGFASKIDLIKQLQAAGYFVLLNFVGLASVELSVGRVLTRVQAGGHNVPEDKLRQRFSRTQHAISQALDVVDAAVLVDNSRSVEEAFTLCQFRLGQKVLYDIRTDEMDGNASSIEAWMSRVVPLHAA